MKTKFNYGELTQRYPVLATGKFTTIMANKVGVTRSMLRHAKGFIKIADTEDVINRNVGNLTSCAQWVYDEELYRLKRKAHRNPAKYMEQYEKEATKYQEQEQSGS